MYTQNSRSRPGKRSLSKAEAATTENTICPVRITATICTVTATGVTKPSSELNRAITLSSTGGAGSDSGPSCANCVVEVSAVITENRNGPSVCAAATISTR